MNAITVKPMKPRNPLVALARFRLAGRHGDSSGRQRRDAKSELRRELNELRRHPPST